MRYLLMIFMVLIFDPISCLAQYTYTPSNLSYSSKAPIGSNGFVSGSASDTIYVTTGGSDTTGTGTSNNPYASLAMAISNASAGNVIKFATGNYNITTAITLDSTNAFALTITGGSSDASATTLSGSVNRLIYGDDINNHNNDSLAWIWKNLTVQNFSDTTSNQDGAAFFLKYVDAWEFINVVFYNNVNSGSNGDGGVFTLWLAGTNAYPITFMDCIFDGNKVTSSGGRGGAMYANATSKADFYRCIFKNNYAEGYGGGVYMWGGILKFYDCLFYKNWTKTYGGGALYTGYNSSWTRPYLTNCTFTENTAGVDSTIYSATNSVSGGKGGAVSATVSDTTRVHIYNTIMFNNDGEGTDYDDLYTNGQSNTNIYNSCFGSTDASLASSAPNYNLAEGTDPLFNNVAGQDYTITIGSPAKNSGCSACPDDHWGSSLTTQTTDLLGKPRIGNYDMGSYEEQTSVSTLINEKHTNALEVYPDPFSKSFTVLIPNKFGQHTLNIYDIAGNRLRTFENSISDRVVVEKGRMTPGVYFIELRSGTQTLKAKVLVE